jgi:hypothetical protein
MERAYLKTGVDMSATLAVGVVGPAAAGARVEPGLSVGCSITALPLVTVIHIPFNDTQLNGT